VKMIDLNCDVGESFGAFTKGCDRSVLESATSANIACGFHAGDAGVMKRTMSICRELGVKAGAHPGYPDMQGFGRREMSASPEEIEGYVLYQLGALDGFARADGMRLSHLKAHGALYNRAAKDVDAAAAIARAVKSFDPALIIVGLANSPMLDVVREMGLRAAAEAFADRAYNPDGTLVSRVVQGSVIHDREEVIKRAVRMATEGVVLGVDGGPIKLDISTICLHGDTEGAAMLAREIKIAMLSLGVKLAPMEEVLGCTAC
jgi:UPF0271 protein